MGHRICTVAGKWMLLPLLVLVWLQCSSAAAQTKEKISADRQDGPSISLSWRRLPSARIINALPCYFAAGISRSMNNKVTFKG